MLYPYITLSDETEILHSQLMEENGKQTVAVHFERPTNTGFDTARCILPDYEWVKCEGYSKEEIAFFSELLHQNAHLIYKYAANGESPISAPIR